MKKQMILFCLTLFLGCFTGSSWIQAQNNDDPYVILVEFTVDEKNRNQVISLLSEMQEQTLENEEGCLIYDVLLSEDDPTKIFIYENYESESAYDIHSNSSYFKAIVSDKLNPLIKESRITKVIPIHQEDELIGEEV